MFLLVYGVNVAACQMAGKAVITYGMRVAIVVRQVVKGCTCFIFNSQDKFRNRK